MAAAAKKARGKYPWSGTMYGDVLTRISKLEKGKSTNVKVPEGVKRSTYFNRLNSALNRFDIESHTPPRTKLSKRSVGANSIRITLTSA